jgi:hypothetical protein
METTQSLPSFCSVFEQGFTPSRSLCLYSCITGRRLLTYGRTLWIPQTTKLSRFYSSALLRSIHILHLSNCVWLMRYERPLLHRTYVDFLEVLLQLLPRPISAPSLTALLATLSGIFKYLLVPSIKLDLLDQTWSSFRAVLPTCSHEVQRAAAEVWGSVLCRLKSVAKQRAVA